MSRRCSSSLFSAPGKIDSGNTFPPRRTPCRQPLRLVAGLGVNSAELQRPGHPVNRDNISRDAVVHPMRFGVPYHLFEALVHNILQSFVHFAFPPEAPLPVLYPLKLTDRHPPGVPQDVRNDENAFILDDFVRMRSGRTIRPLAQNPAFHAVGIATGDLVLGGSWYQDVRGMEQHLLRRLLVAAPWKFRQWFPLPVDPIHQLRNVEPLVVVQPAVNIRDADNLVPRLVHQNRRLRADVSEALNDHPATLALYA